MDRLSQSQVENVVAAMLVDKYSQWVSFEVIWSDVLLWSSMNRHKYTDDALSSRQVTDMYEAIQKNCERAKASVCGYSVDDLCWYSIGYLRELVAQVCAGTHSTRLDCGYADVERALYRLLDRPNRAIIIGVHAGWVEEGESYEEALLALQACLGGRKPKGL